jgi:Arc/MetJ-type ribon-helix-helix transcriptional regulator
MESLLVQFPEKMVEKMNAIVSEGQNGYGSRAELIRDCVRKMIGDK